MAVQARVKPVSAMPSRAMSARHHDVAGLVATLLIFYLIAVVAWSRGNDFLVDTLTLVLIYACAGIAWNIAGGFGGLLSFGHAAFYGLGAYALALWMTNAHGSPWLGLLLGTVAGGVLAGLSLLAMFRLKSHYFIMATVALGEICYVVFLNWSAVGASSGIFIPIRSTGWGNLSFGSDRILYTYVAMFLLAIFLVIAAVLRRSRLGYLISGTRDDEVAAESLGVRTFGVRLSIFVLSGALAGLAGAYYAVFSLFVSPDTVLSLDVSTQIALVAVIGGLGWSYGSVFGAAVTVAISSYANEALGQYGSGLGGLIYGALIIIIALFEPRGLYALVDRLSAWLEPVTSVLLRFQARLPVGGLRHATAASGDVVASAGGLPPMLAGADLSPSEAPVLELRDISKSFGGLQAVRNVSFEVRPGEIVAVVGANGAGKTTLFNCVSGLYRATSGVVRLSGADMTARSAHAVARSGLARTFQLMRNFPELTVRQNCLVAVLASRRGVRAADTEVTACLSWAGLLPVADVPSRELTTADLKRLEVCRALLTRPKVLLLDEVMSGLNPAETTAAVGLVRQMAAAGISVVLVEHIMDVVRRVADRVVVLDSGATLAEGRPDDVLLMPAVVEAYLGVGHAAAGD